MAHPTVRPSTFAGKVSAEMGLVHEFQLSAFSATGQLSARISLSDPASATVGVKRIVVNEVLTVTFTPDDPVPPGSPPLPPQTEETLFKVREGDGSAPLLVEIGNIVTVEILAQGLNPAAAEVAGTLIVSSDAWDPVSATLNYGHDSDVSTTFGALDLTGHQGGVAATDIVVRHLSGPEVEIRYGLIHDASADRIQLDEVNLQLIPGETKRATLTFRISADCPVGRKFLRVDRTGGSLFENETMLQLEVKPAPVIAPEPTLAQAKAVVVREWNRLGGPKSFLGLPVKNEIEVTRIASGFESRFRSGVLAISPNLAIVPPRVTDVVTIDLVGIECQIRQEGTDEIYGVVTVIGPGNNTIKQNRFGPLEMGPPGTRLAALNTTLIEKQVVENYKIHVALVEHDSGDVDAIAKKIADKVREGASAAIGALTGIPAEAVADTQGFDEGLDAGVLFVLDEIFGIGDDALIPQVIDLPWPSIVPGAVSVKEPVTRPGEPQKLENWTHSVVVSGTDDGGDLGQYGIYFRVRPQTETITPPPF